MSRGAVVALIAGVVVVLAAFGAYVLATDCNGVKQALVMRAARRHGEAIAPTLRADPRFAQIKFSGYTAGRCGCMLVRGNVPTEADALALRDAVLATSPPTEVMFFIRRPDDGYPDSFLPVTIPEIPPPR